MTELVLENLSVSLKGNLIVRDASLTVGAGELVVILGPNGAGKTTLVRAALGLIPPSGGEARLGGVASETLGPAVRARLVSYLPQIRPLAWPARVRDLVALGRFAHGAALGRLSVTDAAAVDAAIEACDLTAFASRSAAALSGGELARVHCARAFAAETPLLFADEPVAALDPYHRFRIMDLIAERVAAGTGALVVLHDIALAARVATRLVWMRDGTILAEGPVEETLTPARLAEVYGVEARVDGRRVTLEGPI